MKINIIYAGNFSKYEDHKYDYSSRIYSRGRFNDSIMPLVLPTLAALTPSDFDITLTNENNVNVEAVEFDPTFDLVAISFLTLGSSRAYAIADRFRDIGVYVVMGGIHVSKLPDEAGRHADTIFIGEAEETWPKFIEDFLNGNPKTVYQCESFPDLQKPVMPRWDLLDSEYPVKYVQTTRGCPFKCEFCSTNSFSGKPRHKPVEHVIEEIKEIMRISGSNIIHFADDNLIGNRRYAKALFQALIPLKINWWGAVSMNIAKEDELMELARQSGCFAVLIGIESVNQESLDGVNKGKQNKTDEFIRNINKIQTNGFFVVALMMVGFDEDDNTIFKQTMDFLEEANIFLAAFSMITPLPGTPLFKRLEDADRLLYDDWDMYDYRNVCFEPKRMSKEELRNGFIELIETFYSFENLSQRWNRAWELYDFNQSFNPMIVNEDKVQLSKKYYTDLLKNEQDIIEPDDFMRPYLRWTIDEIWKKDFSAMTIISYVLSQAFHYHSIIEAHRRQDSLYV